MDVERYTPGHTRNVVDFMAARTFETHGQFFAPFLEPNHYLLDVGCGPGTITVGLASNVARVLAIDFNASQTEIAKCRFEEEKLENVTVATASCYEVPCDDHTFDRVFSHALLEHLSDPVKAISEFRRVLRPGGVVGLCCPDFGSRLLIPPSADVEQAADAYAQLQQRNGGDLNAGRKLGAYLEEAGFRNVTLHARYECYPTLDVIAEYLALQLEQAEMPKHAACLRDWSQSPIGMFAQTWVSAVGSAPNE